MPLVLFILEGPESKKKNGGVKPILVGKICSLPLIKIGLTNLLKMVGPEVPICSGGPDSTEFLMLGSNIH